MLRTLHEKEHSFMGIELSFSYFNLSKYHERGSKIERFKSISNTFSLYKNLEKYDEDEKPKRHANSRRRCAGEDVHGEDVLWIYPCFCSFRIGTARPFGFSTPSISFRRSLFVVISKFFFFRSCQITDKD